MKNTFWLSLCLLLPLPATGATLLVLGDSISAAYGMPREAGWVALLDEHLDDVFPRQFDVVNGSISGDTTAGGLVRLPPLLEKHEPELVIVELGGNDGLRGMSLQQMESNLETMVTQSQATGARVAVVSVRLPVSYGVHYNRLFREVYEKVARRHDVLHVAIGFEDLNDRDLLQADGIHPTEAAQPLLFRLVWNTIADTVSDLAVSPGP